MGFFANATKPWIIACALLAFVLAAAFSIGADMEVKAGLMRMSSEQLKESMTPEEQASFPMAIAMIAPIAAFGVTIDSPMQDLTSGLMPGLMGGLGGLAGGAIGGMIGGGIGQAGSLLLGTNMEIRTGVAPVLVALLAAMLLAALLTRDSRAPFLVAFVFCLLDCGYLLLINWAGGEAVKAKQAEMAASSNQYDQAFAPLAGLEGVTLELTPFIWHVLIYTLLLAILARLIIQHFAGIGRFAVEDFSFGGRPSLASALGGLLGGTVAALGSAATPALPALTGGRSRDSLVSFVAVCPFCGNTKLRHNAPGKCAKCRRTIRGLVETAHGHPCYSCSGILLKGSHFCHHCGAWQGIQPKNLPSVDQD
jgi:hypothetical protein